MSHIQKQDFINKIADLFERYCPQMSVDVRFWVACQFALESNFGQSRIAKLNRNYCGMKVPVCRVSLNTSVDGFAAFDTLEDCVLDYVYWLAWNKFQSDQLFNLSLYTRRLIVCKYCPESDYVDRIYTLFNELKHKNNG